MFSKLRETLGSYIDPRPGVEVTVRGGSFDVKYRVEGITSNIDGELTLDLLTNEAWKRKYGKNDN